MSESWEGPQVVNGVPRNLQRIERDDAHPCTAGDYICRGDLVVIVDGECGDHVAFLARPGGPMSPLFATALCDIERGERCDDCFVVDLEALERQANGYKVIDLDGIWRE